MPALFETNRHYIVSFNGVQVAVTVEKVKNQFGEQWVRFRNAHKWIKSADVVIVESEPLV